MHGCGAHLRVGVDEEPPKPGRLALSIGQVPDVIEHVVALSAAGDVGPAGQEVAQPDGVLAVGVRPGSRVQRYRSGLGAGEQGGDRCVAQGLRDLARGGPWPEAIERIPRLPNGVCPGLEQRVRHRQAPHDRGGVERCPPKPVGDRQISPGFDQHLRAEQLVGIRSGIQRRRLRLVLEVQVGAPAPDEELQEGCLTERRCVPHGGLLRLAREDVRIDASVQQHPCDLEVCGLQAVVSDGLLDEVQGAKAARLGGVHIRAALEQQDHGVTLGSAHSRQERRPPIGVGRVDVDPGVERLGERIDQAGVGSVEECGELHDRGALSAPCSSSTCPWKAPRWGCSRAGRRCRRTAHPRRSARPRTVSRPGPRGCRARRS